MTLTVTSGASGIDTVGDVRVPAACCGVLGFRSSHGAISLEGTIPVASSCDALGELLMSTSHANRPTSTLQKTPS